jgi:hypothetical protein
MQCSVPEVIRSGAQRISGKETGHQDWVQMNIYIKESRKMRTRKKTENKLDRNETKEVKCQKLKGEEN